MPALWRACATVGDWGAVGDHGVRSCDRAIFCVRLKANPFISELSPLPVPEVPSLPALPILSVLSIRPLTD